MKTPMSLRLLATSLVVCGTAPGAGAQSLHGWGTDLFSQLANQPAVAFAQVEGGNSHSVGLALDGSLHSWGIMYKPTVTATPVGNDFVQVDAGREHSIALRSDGSLESWGEDNHGQVSNTPTGTGFTFVCAGGDYSLAIRTDGSIEAWGYDLFGAVTGVPTGAGYVEVSCGSYHALARHGTGWLVSWGRNNYGQVTNTPAGSDFVQVSAGGEHSLARRSNGTVDAWGKDSYGVVSSAPTTGGFKDIAGGQYTDLALTFDGSIVAWGDDTFGLIAGAPAAAGYDDVSSSSAVAMALLSDCNGNGVADSLDLAAGTSTDFDGNQLPDECEAPPLYADRFDLSVAAGGTQTFYLAPGEQWELRAYLLLGSVSGTSPGQLLDGKLLPLVVDSYLLHTLTRPNQPPLGGSFGLLSPKLPGPGGQATATLTLPPAFDASLVGLTLHHAFLIVELGSGYTYYTSNAVPTALLP